MDLLSGIAGARRLLHLPQHREQILQGGDLRRADLLIEVKPNVRPVGGLRGLRGLIRGKKGDLTGTRPEALLPRQIRAALDGALVAGQVLLAGEVRGKVQDKTRLDHIGEIVPVGPDQDEVPQIPVGGPRLVERVPAARGVRRDQVELHVEALLHRAGKPAGLDALVVGLGVKDVHREKFRIAPIPRSCRIAPPAGGKSSDPSCPSSSHVPCLPLSFLVSGPAPAAPHQSAQCFHGAFLPESLPSHTSQISHKSARIFAVPEGSAKSRGKSQIFKIASGNSRQFNCRDESEPASSTATHCLAYNKIL